MAQRGGLYFSHVRGESAMVEDSIREAIRIGEEAGVGVQIAHVKVGGRENWGKMDRVLRLIDDARTRGVDVLDGADVAVPVPLHPSRRRERGFNQAEDLARHVGLPAVAALRRVRRTPAQADLPAAKRHGNVKGAFALNRQGDGVSNKVVVLIDDVSTTGATLDACAHVLKQAGAREVRALTAARVVTQRR